MTNKPNKKPKIPKPRRSRSMFQCEKCGKQFRRIDQLIKHTFKEHDPSK